jgi:mono/diheme cytochrome c family protein
MDMRKVLKWVGIVIGVLVGVVIAAAVLLYFTGGARLNQTRQVQPLAIAIHNDEAALARGEHLVKAACTSCHIDDLSGTPFIADLAIGTIYAANISGLGERRTDEELVLAIRHGIGPGGRQLAVMPSDSFIHFSEEDLSAVIAYLKTVPRTGEDTPEPILCWLSWRGPFWSGLL